jgi:hypothetical protein
MHEREKVLRRISGQCRLGKMWIAGKEVFRTAMNVGEIAAAAPRDENLLSRTFCNIENCASPSSFAGFDGAHQSSRACA